MTPEGISTMSHAVAQRFGLWTPGQMCNYGDVRCRHFDEPLADTWDELTQGKFKPHEIPCPDLTQAEHFVRLLKASRGTVWPVGNQWAANMNESSDMHWYHYDTPEEALLCVAYQLVQRETTK